MNLDLFLIWINLLIGSINIIAAVGLSSSFSGIIGFFNLMVFLFFYLKDEWHV